MPELPWAKWYYTLWASEPGLWLCEPATRGIWFDAVNHMMMAGTDHLSGTLEELTRLCRCRSAQMALAISELQKYKVAEVTMQNECTILTCRKRTRDCKTSQARRKAANDRWMQTPCKPDANGDAKVMQHPTLDTHAPSTSTYTSTSKQGGAGGIELFTQLAIRLGILFSRGPHDRFTYAEESAISEISRRPAALSELGEIESFKAKEPKYFPRTLTKVVTQWQELLDQARAWVPNRSPEQERQLKNWLNQL